MTGHAQHAIAALLTETTRLQAQAADPTASVWVSANAGTGKTHVLTQRVLRLLLTGVAPETILCLTYTKAAAAEMSKRVFEKLAEWVGFDPQTLDQALAKLLGHAPSAIEVDRARTLFTRAIETPGGFKVQTIHAFCERLLQRFPLEAGVAPGFEILDDQTGRQLIRDAINATLERATADPHAPLGQALATTIKYAVEDQFDTVLGDAITKRALLEALLRRSQYEGHPDAFSAAHALLRQAFNLGKDVTNDSLASLKMRVIDETTLKDLRDALRGGSKTDNVIADALTDAMGRGAGAARFNALCAAFLTKEGEARKSLMTKAIANAHPELLAQALAAQHRCVSIDEQGRALDAITATLALYRLADDVLQGYATAKAARAALDFEDLIVKTGHLLSRPEGAKWVLYKLDSGLRHILVDEAQDTAPPQWTVIEALATEFFSDLGAGARGEPRTVFAVGDEKQSIYSFQGAEPTMFAQKGHRFEELAGQANSTWRRTALTLSFRTVSPVLHAVDQVFSNHAVTPGLTADTSLPIRHAVKRVGQGGLVEIWPLELPDDKTPSNAWAPLDETTPTSPVTRLAARIAATIKGWLVTGERLTSQDRPITAGDIIILVRKRRPFAPAIVAALKAADIPVAGADRLSLTEQIGVQDLLALGDFITLPEDDLALATVLKCPLLGLTDNDLLALAPKRKGTLWQALLNAAKTNAEYATAAEQLKRWRKDADFLPPFEFFSALLDQGGGRMKMLNRLGSEAADGLDEFLNFALTFDDSAPPSLTGFLMAIRDGDRTIKRDMDQGRDEVRVLTVHGSKGLEAPIVFLPDTCSTKSARSANGLIQLSGSALPSSMPELVVWPVKGTSKLAPIMAAKETIKAGETEELHRLLYVALTRPRDRLYVAGAQTSNKRAPGCWYDLMSGAMQDQMHTVVVPGYSDVRRLIAEQSATTEVERAQLSPQRPAAPRPEWMTRNAPRVGQPTIPLAPSRLAPLDIDDSGELVVQPLPVPRAPSEPVTHSPVASSHRVPDGPDRFLRGTLTHALLEHLPTLDPSQWHTVAMRYIEARGSAYSAKVRSTIVGETLAVLNDPVFAPMFGPGSRAEVPIVAELPNPSGKGPALKLNGQIDRLAEVGHEILIVDYKTNRPAPRDLKDVPEVYLLQLAAYRAALQVIFPGRTVRATLLWTEIALLMPVPSQTLDIYGGRLWTLNAGP
jgi:ATP-dependent helicase/nuclease subunit A